MAEITGHEPIADAAVLLQTDMGERFKIDGFKGLRRVEIKRFASQFFIREDNPNGTIEAFKDDMPKDTMVPMMDLYLSQGKFGDDPFNLRPQDKMAALEAKLEALQAKFEGPKANPATEVYAPQPPNFDLDPPNPPPAKITEPMVQAPSVSLIPGGEDGPQDTALEDMSFGEVIEESLENLSWKELRTKAKNMGLKPFHKTRTVVISEIEAKEAGDGGSAS